jgi:hypothetical protein
MRKIFYAILSLGTFVVFTLGNLFTFILGCNETYCYYENCHCTDIDERMDCFLELTTSLNDWLMLDLISGGYILGIGCVIFVAYTSCVKIKKIISHNNRSGISYKKNVIPYESIKKYDKEIKEEEELLETGGDCDPLLLV